MAFVGFLKQSTATTLRLGPFLDETDGKTAETALTITQSDVLLWKEGGTTAAQKNEATSATHRENGYYTCPLNTTDTNTLGALSVSVSESGALPIRQDYVVLPATAYAPMVDGTDLWPVDVQQIDNSTTAPENLALTADAMVQGTSDNTAFTGTTTIFESDTITEATADHYNGRVIVFTSGALAKQATLIEDYALNGGRGRFTVTALTEAVPDNTTFVIV